MITGMKGAAMRTRPRPVWSKSWPRRTDRSHAGRGSPSRKKRSGRVRSGVGRRAGGGVEGTGGGGFSRGTGGLQVAGGDPAPAGEEPGADHGAAVEVVALVPAVVGDLVPLVGLDQREEHAADFDRRFDRFGE